MARRANTANLLAQTLDVLTRSFGPVKERERWTDRDKEILEECLPDLVEAARRLGRPFIAVQSRAYELGHNKTHDLSMVKLRTQYAAELAALGSVTPYPLKKRTRQQRSEDNALLCPCGQDKAAPLKEHAEWCDKRRAPETKPISVVTAKLSEPVSLELFPTDLELHIANVKAAKQLYLESKADLLKFVEEL